MAAANWMASSIGIIIGGACLFIGSSLYLYWQITTASASSKRRRGRQQLPESDNSSTAASASSAGSSTRRGGGGGGGVLITDNCGVFLSSRGKDMGFTGHLYEALHNHGVRTFLDNEELERGQSLKPQLNQAIQKSEIAIVVISASHAVSRWCLDELLAIVQYGKPVIPIFYHVDPSDFRKQTGPFAEAFKKHEIRFGAEKVKEWKDAMTTIANHSGYNLEKTADGYGNEAKVVKMIIRDVMEKVNKGKANEIRC